MKQNIIQSIIRRGLSFVFLSLLMPLGVGAQTNYDLWIGNTQVTSENASNVLGDGKVTFSIGGDVAVVYTLTLNGAELTAPVKVGLSNLTFDIQGTNSITTSEACIQKMDNTSPSLTFKSTANDVGSLILTNNNGPISEIGKGNISVSKELAVLLKVYGTEDYTSDLYYITDGSTTGAKIVPSYGVQVNDMQVYAGNATDVLKNGKVSFDKETATLTLNNVSDISTISTTLSTLNIELVGSNSLYRSSDGSIFESLSGEAVTINIKSTGSIKGGLTIETPENYGATIKGDNVTLTPQDPIALLSSNVENNKGTLVYGVSYNLWVAGTQVTTANANHITGDGIGDGEVAFDGVNTLKLSGANLAGPIQSSLANLIVEIEGPCIFGFGQAAAPYAFITEEAGSILTFTTKEPSSSISVSGVQSAPFSGYADGNIKFLNELVGSLSETGSGYQIAVPNASYGFSVDDVEVTKKNRLSIGDGVKFDGRNTLILANAEISGIYISNNHILTNGLNIYLIGENTIRNSSNAVYGTQIPLSISTSSENPGSLAYICQACSLATANQAFNGYTVAYKNDLIATLDYTNTEIQEKNLGKSYEDPTYIKQQTVTIAPGLVPVVDESGDEANLDGGGSGLGTVLEGHENDTQVITADKKMLLTLGEKDGFFSWTPSTTGDDAELWDGEESAKLVVLSTEQNGVPEDKEPTTPEFATGYKGVTMAIPAGSYEVACDYKNIGNGQLVVQVGRGKDAQKFRMPPRVTHNRSSIQFVTQRPQDVFLYNGTCPEGFSRFRAPGRKMANTTTLKSVKVSARSVAATPPPVLMPKVLTKDDVAAAKSGNHITITDTDVTDYAGDAFEGQTGITYVDLSATSITGKKIDRNELPASATVFLPASNDDNLAKNIVIAGVCNDLQLNDAVDFEIPSDFTAVKASLNRDFTSDLGKNCTVCVPFALDDTQAAELGTFYTLSAHSGNTITMESVDATEANKAYMFKPVKETFSAEMVDVKKADPVCTTVSSLSFLGTYQQIPALNSTADFVYYCFMKDGPQAGKFVKITSDVTVNPFRAYMKLPASESLARVLDLNFGEGGATGIGSLTPNPSSIGEGNVGFYDLQGRRVLYPKKGLYILNGKKVIIK